MSTSLTGKVAIVTGGTRGIGRAVAQALAAGGCSVALCGRTLASATQAASEIAASTGARVIGLAADCARLEDVQKFFRAVTDAFGGADFLINNAGVGIFKPTADLSPVDWHRMLDLNLSGIYYCSHEMLPILRQRGGGYIVNISSLAAKNPFAGGAGYNASKFGVTGFTEAMMLDHRKEKIRVSHIMPGSVDTDFSPRSSPAAWKIQPEDIAEIVLMLLRMPERTTVSRVEVRPSIPQ